MKAVRILRIDPDRRTVASLTLKGAKDATPQIRRILRTKNVGSRQIMTVEGGPLMVIGGLDVAEEMRGWRLPGTDDTAGVAMMTGRDPATGFLIDVPVSAEWVRERIHWLEGEDVEGREARAAETMPLLNDEIRRAIREAIVLPDSIWISAEDKAKLGEAMQTLGLGDERSGGQKLTPLGEKIHDGLMGEEN